MFKLRRYLAGHYVECVLAPLFKGLEALLQLEAPVEQRQRAVDGLVADGLAHRRDDGITLPG